MVMVEGKGNIAPAAKSISLSDHEVRCIVAGAREIDRYKSRRDSWGGGLIRESALGDLIGLTQTEVPIVAGKCGEYAVWRLACDALRRTFPPVDFTRRARGDGGIDLNLGGASIQVKTRVTFHKNLVQRTNQKGAVLPLAGSLHVFCSWNRDFWVKVLGYLPNSDILRLPVDKSHRGDWTNYVAHDRDLLPISRLWADIEWRISA